MKIKLTTFYALQAIHKIYKTQEEVVTSNKIAQDTGISQGVLLKLLRGLDKADILKAHQGRGNVSGGFSLNRNIDNITLLEIIDIFEGVDIRKNLEGDLRMDSEQLCGSLNEINENIREELSKYTVQDLF